MKLQIVSFFVLISSICFGQNDIRKFVDYAGISIEVPKIYNSKTESEISGNGFRASWMYFLAGSNINQLSDQITKQFERQLPLTNKKDISFISSNSEFTGKQYLLDNKSYVILAFGKINNQLIFLNMNFETEPRSNEDFDELMKRFIVYK